MCGGLRLVANGKLFFNNPSFEKILGDIESGKNVLPPPKALPKDSESY